MTRLRLLHLHSGFAAASGRLRAVSLMNALGRHAEHVAVFAETGQAGADYSPDPKVAVTFPDDFPPLAGFPFPRRLLRIAQAMQGHDLVLTYGWGAINAVLAHTLFAEALGLPPLVHHEDDLGAAEATRLKPLRTWTRRIALARAQGLIVPSQQLEFVARQGWKQPRRMVHRIPIGIPVAKYATSCAPDALPRVIKRKGELWLGAYAGAHDLDLVRALAALPGEWQLVILGEAAQRDGIRQLAMELGIGHRVHVPGLAPEPAGVFGLFDLLVLPADGDPGPLPVMQAMAAGLALVAPRAGEVEALVAPENRRFLVAPDDAAALAGVLDELAADDAMRVAVGAANRARATAEYDEAATMAACRGVYAAAMGRATMS